MPSMVENYARFIKQSLACYRDEVPDHESSRDYAARAALHELASFRSR